ncbi:MAG: 3-methyl-2-oxobutanoate hydroxymethyltransferase [bacterium]|nr:3-methyl-2-oxobutanoate hydroxymethyltransferase [bacterium]
MPRLEEKITILTLKKKKKRGEKISAVTAYDFPSAQVASQAGMDLILVGDSLGMVLQGYENTLKVTVDEMIYHTRLVTNANPHSLVVIDMPYGSFHVSPGETVRNAIRMVKEGGAEAIKLEGGRQRSEVIKAVIDAEIPVMGHLGLTPQSVHRLGGYKPQGKMKRKAEEMKEEALALEKLGVFAIVLESIPIELGKEISESISIPTIGIGAGKYCDGQVLVFHDLLGFTDAYLPKFVRKYADIHSVIQEALENYIKDILSGDFPGEKESFHRKTGKAGSTAKKKVENESN